jgi:hypothetical protein
MGEASTTIYRPREVNQPYQYITMRSRNLFSLYNSGELPSESYVDSKIVS